MGQLVIQGSLTAQGSTGSFPTASFADSLAFQGGQRPYQSATGMISRTVSSPSSFAALSGIGATNDVAKADFFYLASNAPLDVQIVADDGLGGSTTVVVSCSGGPLIISAAANKMITAVGVKGSGQIEYFASGP